MNDFFMDGKRRFYTIRGKRRVMRYNYQCRRICALSNSPHVQVRQSRTVTIKIFLDHLPYFFNHSMIHFAVQQNFPGFN